MTTLPCRYGFRSAAVLAAALLAGRPLAGQAARPVPDDARRLVVQVLSYFESRTDPDVTGAGIVVGETADGYVIATAAHLVRLGNASPRAVRVVFEFARGDTVSAAVRRAEPPPVDVAVLTAPRPGARAGARPALAFDRQARTGYLRSGDPVFAVGCPDGSCWGRPATPDRLIGRFERGLIFESNFISPGSSGGALFSEQWEVAGMVIEKSDPQGAAVPVDQLVRRVRDWKYPVSLRHASIPRSGYMTDIGASVLVSMTHTDRSLDPESRLPSGRITLTRHTRSVLSWHLSGVRLAPPNTAVHGALAGVDLNLRAGRVALRPFGELGLGRVKGRYDAGGLIVSEGAGQHYEPFWQRVQADGIGRGVGASLQWMALPHLSLDLTGGAWAFSVPTQIAKPPAAYFGVGARFGL